MNYYTYLQLYISKNHEFGAQEGGGHPTSFLIFSTGKLQPVTIIVRANALDHTVGIFTTVIHGHRSIEQWELLMGLEALGAKTSHCTMLTCSHIPSLMVAK